jgi:hypothetical protein
MDCHFDNLAAAATNSHATLDQLTSATTDQYAEIKVAPAALAVIPHNKPAPLPGIRSRTALPLTEKRAFKERILVIQAAVKNGWKLGDFCLTYDHGAGADHDSKTCNGKRNMGKPGGHDVTAIFTNPVGPGKDTNKGWDAWLL